MNGNPMHTCYKVVLFIFCVLSVLFEVVSLLYGMETFTDDFTRICN